MSKIVVLLGLVVLSQNVSAGPLGRFHEGKSAAQIQVRPVEVCSAPKAAPLEVSSPKEGQIFDLNSLSAAQVVLADQDYRNTRVRFYGTEALGDEVQFIEGTNSPAHMIVKHSTGHQPNSCTRQSPCTVLIVVSRGEKSTVVPIKFVRGEISPQR